MDAFNTGAFAAPDHADDFHYLTTVEGRRAPAYDADTKGEDKAALKFAAAHASVWRFDHDAERWFGWDASKGVWRRDATGGAHEAMRPFSRAAAVSQDGKQGPVTNAAIRGALAIASRDPRLVARADQWDADPLLLGTPGGTVDLRTGRLRDPDPADNITRLAGAAIGEGEPVEWLRFLHEATGGDGELIGFLRRWLGYCLTGSTSEQRLLFVHGPGGTGKSVFANIATALLGELARTADMTTFAASPYDKHTTDLASLAGARLVTASETETGRAWAEQRLKSLTGGDPITARFMRQDNFTFRPSFKIVIVGNHAPRLNDVGEAMRRRFLIVPFTIKPQSRDDNLEAKIKRELPQIARWAVRGCLDWQANGLQSPKAVEDATSRYFEDEDVFGQWLADRCASDSNGFEPSGRLFNSWREYASAANAPPGTQASFKRTMETRGFRHRRTMIGRVFDGVRLNEREHNHGDES